MEKKEIVVVIPVYRPILSKNEYIALRQCVSLLFEYPIIILKPESLDINTIILEYPQLQLESFPDEDFSSLRAYNKLVLKDSFYRRFQRYTYMLIYQLDAYVFEDKLLDWASRGYDYIGAPWIPAKKRYRSTFGKYRLLTQRYILKLFNSKSYKLPKFYPYQVGNGGLSLRKINSMIALTSYYKEKISELLDDNKEFYPEDIFLLLEVTDKQYRLKKPSFKEALMFSMDERPDLAYQYNHRNLPFGCHAWYHEDYYPFWSKIIQT